MKKYIFISIFLVPYLFHLLLKFSKTPVPEWASSYFADALCMPLLLAFALIFIRKSHRNEHFYISWQKVGFVFIFWSLMFELFLPLISTRYTADFFDVILYFFGSIFFFIIQKKVF